LCISSVGSLIMPFILIPLIKIDTFFPFYILTVMSLFYVAFNILLPKETKG